MREIEIDIYDWEIERVWGIDRNRDRDCDSLRDCEGFERVISNEWIDHDALTLIKKEKEKKKLDLCAPWMVKGMDGWD